MRQHLSTFKLDIPSEVTVIGTGCKKNTFGEGRTPTIHLIEPGKCAGTEPHGSKPETTVGVLWGPDSFLFRSDILSKWPSKHTEIVMDSHSLLQVSGLRTPSPGLGGVKKLYWTGRNPVLSFPTASPRSRLRSKQSDPMAGFVVAILPQLPKRQNMKNVHIKGIPNLQWDTHDSL